ncbi:MAG: YitT family protein [Clostridia bacterium]|nr:YitT family protein [Clostridia bacterium]
MKETIRKTYLKNILMFAVGIALTALAIAQFTLPNKIVGGGVSGISTILYHTLGIGPGISTAVINAILLLIGIKVLGKRFVVATLAGVSLLSVLVELFSYLPPITENIILASVFGGVFYGVGIGLALAAGGSSGGTDILGRLIQHFFPHFPIGTLIMFVDGVVIAFSYVFFGNLELTLFGVVTLAVSTYAIDSVIRKLNVSKLAFIVSKKGDEIAKMLVTTAPRGCTIINTVGAYTQENNKMLVCALKDNELPAFQRKVLEIDPMAFIIFSESSQIVGNGFHVYR